MKRLMMVVAVAASLVGVPALGQEPSVVQGSDRDPFSQTYTGGAFTESDAGHDRSSKHDAKGDAKSEKAGSARCSRSCDCGHHGDHGAGEMPSKV